MVHILWRRCGHCKKLEPIYDDVAKELHAAGTPGILYVIECELPKLMLMLIQVSREHTRFKDSPPWSSSPTANKSNTMDKELKISWWTGYPRRQDQHWSKSQLTNLTQLSSMARLALSCMEKTVNKLKLLRPLPLLMITTPIMWCQNLRKIKELLKSIDLLEIHRAQLFLINWRNGFKDTRDQLSILSMRELSVAFLEKRVLESFSSTLEKLVRPWLQLSMKLLRRLESPKEKSLWLSLMLR